MAIRVPVRRLERRREEAGVKEVIRTLCNWRREKGHLSDVSTYGQAAEKSAKVLPATITEFGRLTAVPGSSRFRTL
jgi:hypothetical protein